MKFICHGSGITKPLIMTKFIANCGNLNRWAKAARSLKVVNKLMVLIQNPTDIAVVKNIRTWARICVVPGHSHGQTL